LQKIILSRQFNIRTIANIGLGTGNLLKIADSSSSVDFYELDPDVYTIADHFFTYIKDSDAQLNFYFGDGRKMLEQNPEQKYDLLTADAFVGDTIPSHLITREALSIYRNHLTPEGMLAFYVTSDYIEFGNIIAKSAFSLNADVCFKNEQLVFRDINLNFKWVIITWNHDVFKKIDGILNCQKLSPDQIERIRLWTDDYSSILPIIKYESLLDKRRE